MNIVIFALGSQGDVQPYIALGVGLQRAGHTVRLATHQNYERAVVTHGLEFHAMHGDVQALVESEEMRRLLERGNFLEISRRTTAESQRASVQWAKDGLGACRDAELLVAGVGGLFLALSLAEKLELPLLRAFVFPFTPTSAFPAALFPKSLGRFGGTVNRWSHEALRQIMWQGSRGGDALARQEVLELKPAPFFGPYASKRLNRFPALYGFSPSVIPPPKDWTEARVTGYWFLDAASDWTPPPRSRRSERGARRVWFGSMGSR
ncbi:MAG: glycosyltransferase family 1 protein, partial [Pleurocapsa sp. SU_196_0]|nr:glycosyltransferase family 1 protein [Pleurocapsa sp. SU_196_0]